MKMKKYDEMINELVEIEMNEYTHDDSPEDYGSKLEFYLSNAEQDSYLDYIKSNYKVTTEEAIKIQAEVITEIKRRYEAIQLAASMAGRKGGSAKTERKAQAARKNGKKGGRPKSKHKQVAE